MMKKVKYTMKPLKDMTVRSQFADLHIDLISF